MFIVCSTYNENALSYCTPNTRNSYKTFSDNLGEDLREAFAKVLNLNTWKL